MNPSQETLEQLERLVGLGGMSAKEAIEAAYQMGVLDGKLRLAAEVGKRLSEVVA